MVGDERIGFGSFIGLHETDAPELLQRMSSGDLPVSGDRYGVHSRLIATPGTTVADLAVAVLEKVMKLTRLSVPEIGAVVLSSRIEDPDRESQRMAERLGLSGTAHGIERACSGFPAGTELALATVRRLRRPVALVNAEIISSSVNWEPAGGDLSDQRRARGQAAKLFADGAASVVLGPLGRAFPHEILDAWHGDVADGDQLIQKTEVEDAMDPWGNVWPGPTTCMSMPGRRGFWLVKRAPQIMADAVRQSLANASGDILRTGELVQHIVPHQANGLILSRLQKLINENEHHAEVWDRISNWGNTVSASIPLAMSEVQQTLPPGSLVALPSVGAGGPGYRPDILSHGCVLCRMGEASVNKAKK